MPSSWYHISIACMPKKKVDRCAGMGPGSEMAPTEAPVENQDAECPSIQGQSNTLPPYFSPILPLFSWREAIFLLLFTRKRQLAPIVPIPNAPYTPPPKEHYRHPCRWETTNHHRNELPTHPSKFQGFKGHSSDRALLEKCPAYPKGPSASTSSPPDSPSQTCLRKGYGTIIRPLHMLIKSPLPGTVRQYAQRAKHLDG